MRAKVVALENVMRAKARLGAMHTELAVARPPTVVPVGSITNAQCMRALHIREIDRVRA